MNATLQDFLEKNKMHYEVIKEQATRTNADGNTVPIEGQFHLVRSTDGEVISPSTVSSRYSVTNPIKMVEPIAPLISEGWITPDKAFLFKSGSYEVLSFKMDASQLDDGGKIGGEQWIHWVSLHNHQGGGGGLKGSLTSFRPICENMAAAAAKEACFTIRHTGKIDENYQIAVDRWQKLKDGIRKLSKRMEIFADTKMNAKEALSALRTIYGVKDSEDPSTRTQNEITFALQEFSNPNRGTFGRSAADLFNAITSTNTRYAPASSKESANQRMSTILDANGSRFKLELDTVNHLEEMAGV